MNKEELRPCIVTIATYPQGRIKGNAIIEQKTETHKGYFHTWAVEAYVTNGFLSGTTAGQMSTLYGIVEYEDGTIHRLAPECIRFTDREVETSHEP